MRGFWCMFGFTICFFALVFPEILSDSREVYMTKTICEYEYNVKDCFIDYINDDFIVFDTDKGYIIKEK